MGYAMYETLPREQRSFFSNWRMIALLVVVANLPDLDFLPGFFVGDPNRYHHQYLSHSLGFAVFVGAIFGLYFFVKHKRRFWPGFLIFGGVCFSHMVLDFFTTDTGEPFGLPIFWPLTHDYFYSPISIFMSVNKGGSNVEFIESLFVLSNLWVVLWEIAVGLPILLMIKLIKSGKQGLKLRLRRTI